MKKQTMLAIAVLLLLIPASTTSTGSSDAKEYYYARTYGIVSHYTAPGAAEELSNALLDYSYQFFHNYAKAVVFAAMIACESSYSYRSGDNGSAYGIGQMHIETARVTAQYLGIRVKTYRQFLYNDKNAIHFTIAYVKYITQKDHVDFYTAIGIYNARIPEHQKIYKKRIVKIMKTYMTANKDKGREE